jgi:pilus assembly protein CpaB
MVIRRPSLVTVLALVAVVAGTLAALGTHGYIDRALAEERDRLQPDIAMVGVVVARRDLQRGDPVSAETMAVRQIPSDLAPSSGISPERFESYIGSTLTLSVRSGEPLLTVAIAGSDAAHFSQRLRTGFRAITIAVDEVNALSGMLQPGDRIDLMLTARAADARNDGHDQTIVLMQDVLILATGRQVHPDLRGDAESSKSQERQFGAITIEVDPDRAQRLIVAQRSGRITAILRNPTDRGAIPKAAMDVNALLGGARVPSGLRWPIPPEMIVGGQGVVMASSALSPLVAVPLAPAGRPTPIGPTPSPATPAPPAIPAAPGVIP